MHPRLNNLRQPTDNPGSEAYPPFLLIEVPPMLFREKAFAVLFTTFALASASADTVTRVIAWGNDSENQTLVPSNLSGVSAISAGEFHALALRSDGTVTGWGDNQSGQSSPPTGLKDVKSIAAGGFHSLALRKDGSVVAWGRNDFGQSKVPRQVTAALAIAAGKNHSLALLYDGRVIAWGQNTSGQCDVPGEMPAAQSVSALGDWSSATLSTGRRADWGDLSQKPLRPPASVPHGSMIAASTHHGLALLKDGNLTAWGANQYEQSTVPASLKKARAVAVGKDFSMAIVELETQEVKLDPIGSIVFQVRPLPVNAEASSHLPVTLSSSAPDIVSCGSDNKLVMHRAGLATITATQPGNHQYAPASAASLIRIGLGDRKMRSFEPIPALKLGMHPNGVELHAKASAGDDPIIFTSSNPGVARIEGNRLYTVGIGRARISAQAKQSAQYNFTPALYQTIEIEIPSDEQILKVLFANRIFEGEANFKTMAGTTEKISCQYNIAFDGAIYGKAERKTWPAPSSDGEDGSTNGPPSETSKSIVRGSVSAPFQFKTDEHGRIIEGSGTGSLRFAKGFFCVGPFEFNDGHIQFKGPLKSLTRGHIKSGSCSSFSAPPPPAEGLTSSQALGEAR